MRSVLRRSRSPKERRKNAEELIKDIKSREGQFLTENLSGLEVARDEPTTRVKSGGVSSRHRGDHPSLACIFPSTSYQRGETFEENAKNVANTANISIMRSPSKTSGHDNEQKQKSQRRRGRSLPRLFQTINRNQMDVSKGNLTNQKHTICAHEAFTSKPEFKHSKGKTGMDVSSLVKTVTLAKCALPSLKHSIPINGNDCDCKDSDVKDIQTALKNLEQKLVDAKRSGEELNRTQILNDLLAVIATINEDSPSNEVLMNEISSICISAVEGATKGASLNSSITGSDCSEESTVSNDFIDHMELFTFEQIGAIFKSFAQASCSSVDSSRELCSHKLSRESRSDYTAETESLSTDDSKKTPKKEKNIQSLRDLSMPPGMIKFPGEKMSSEHLCSGNDIICQAGSAGCHPLAWMKINEEELNNILDDLLWGAHTFEKKASKGKVRKSGEKLSKEKVYSAQDVNRTKELAFDPFAEIVASRTRLNRSWSVEEHTQCSRASSETSSKTSESKEVKNQSFFQSHGKKFREKNFHPTNHLPGSNEYLDKKEARKGKENKKPPTNILLKTDDSVETSFITNHLPQISFEHIPTTYKDERKGSKTTTIRRKYSQLDEYGH